MTVVAEPVAPLTEHEERARFEAYCQRYLQMSAHEFLVRWRAGEYPDPDKVPGLMRVVMVMPDGSR